MKTDLQKRFKTEYRAGNKPEIIATEKADYLSIAGSGDPSSAGYAERVKALYATAYTLKFLCKAAERDFIVSKLEGQWWFDEDKFPGLTIANAPQRVPRSEWNYRMLIRIPDYVCEDQISKAREKVISKQKSPLAGEVRSYQIPAGKVVQMLHVGPFDTEPESLAIIGAFVTKNKLAKNGLHHEIYLSDYRKTAPEKLRTILREPVKQIQINPGFDGIQ